MHKFKEKYVDLITSPMQFVANSLIDNIPAMIEMMACLRPGDKPFSEPMAVSLLTRICATRPQWANYLKSVH